MAMHARLRGPSVCTCPHAQPQPCTHAHGFTPPQYTLPLERDPESGTWVGSTHLTPGQYCYQYVLDTRAAHNPDEECGVYPGRGVVNVVGARVWGPPHDA